MTRIRRVSAQPNTKSLSHRSLMATPRPGADPGARRPTPGSRMTAIAKVSHVAVRACRIGSYPAGSAIPAAGRTPDRRGRHHGQADHPEVAMSRPAREQDLDAVAETIA